MGRAGQPGVRRHRPARHDNIHARGLEAHVWTVNGGQDMRRATSWGVDGIITIYPQVLRDILRRC